MRLTERRKMEVNENRGRLCRKKLQGKIRKKKNYEGENETYIEASAENSGSTLYDKEIRDKPRTRHTKRNV